MKQDVSTWLIEENSFVREGLKSLLSKSEYTVTLELESLQDIQRHTPEEPGLIIIGTDNAPCNLSKSLSVIKSRYPDAHLILLSPTLDPKSIIECFSCGIDGYVLKDISGDAFIRSLDLVMLGEKVFPTSMATLLSSGWSEKQEKHAPEILFNQYHLSSREVDIVKCLTSGETNKTIARRLEITESTVKVHLKTILRKLRVSNRTQAAIWAVSNGIKPPEDLPQIGR